MKRHRNQRRSRSLTKRADNAALPFKLLERLGIPCGYERSFKMSRGKLLANRYLLGISLQDTTSDDLFELCLRLKMPAPLFAQFQQNIPGANLVFLGFEDDEGGASYRVYLEYWDKICAEITAAPHETHPRLMFLGYKWNIKHPERQVLSEYICHPLLSTSEIIQRITQLYQPAKDRRVLEHVLDIIQRASVQCADRSFIYLEVGEGNNPRRSFDLNMYKASLSLHEIDQTLCRLQAYYEIQQQSFLKVKELVGPKLLGHLSGGTNRQGEDFLTFYYEN